MDGSLIIALSAFAAFAFAFAGCWLALTQYHTSVLQPFILDLMNNSTKVHNVVLQNWHDNKLLPSLSLLAGQRIATQPPQQELPAEVAELATRKTREPLKDNEIDKIWDRVSATL